MNAGTLEAEAPTPSTTAEEAQPYVFSYDVTPGATPFSQPVVEAFGPASLTALVTTLTSGIVLDLLQEGFPPGTTFEFNQAEPMQWHDACGVTTPQPTWVADLQVGLTRISFTVDNPAGTTDPKGLTQPIIAGFTPKIVRVLDGETQDELKVPDPTIVNIDPTGG